MCQQQQQQHGVAEVSLRRGLPRQQQTLHPFGECLEIDTYSADDLPALAFSL